MERESEQRDGRRRKGKNQRREYIRKTERKYKVGDGATIKNDGGGERDKDPEAH